MKLKAYHKKGFYKNENAWLRAVYRRNKDIIDPVIGDGNPTFKKFKALVNERKMDSYVISKYGKDVSTREAVQSLGSSELFMTKSERMISNAWKAITASKWDKKYIRQVIGWKTKLDPANLVWDEKQKMYSYTANGRRVWIDFNNSPKKRVGGSISFFQDIDFNGRLVAVNGMED